MGKGKPSIDMSKAERASAVEQPVGAALAPQMPDRAPAGFGSRLQSYVERRESQLVLGLDPDPSALWPAAAQGAPVDGSASRRAAAAVAAHCRLLIAAAGPACVAVKPQLACFERMGGPGWTALSEVIACAHAADLLVIADGKRGDVPITARAYAQALLGPLASPFGDLPGLGADAFTVNPLLGEDALEPFLQGARGARAGVFALVRTSNAGAADVQDLVLADGRALWEHLAEIVARLGEGAPSDVGAVVGATQPGHLERMRALMPNTVFLLPGVGAQGGRVEELAPAFAGGRAYGLVTASRSIAGAYRERNVEPARAARAEAERLRELAWGLGG